MTKSVLSTATAGSNRGDTDRPPAGSVAAPAPAAVRGDDVYARLAGPTLSAVRVVIGFLWLCHGLMAMFGWFGGVDGHGGAAAVGSWPGYWAGLIELVGGSLILIGLATRPAALIGSGAMAYAYFSVHQPEAALPIQNMGESAALYSWIFLLFAVLGAGPFSADALLRRRRARSWAVRGA
ncbi:DoxX family protein [Rhodococcus daqingensis]|uniref:DoxX family protein n=1 Tax=Rhodococcus daqingensis TaxID=2479363 RepID=A0ABW2RZG7_9NOCA